MTLASMHPPPGARTACCACRGFDIDSWRAHLNSLTWPEVARQVAVTAGLGRRRPKPRKEEKAKLGTEGEDTVQDESGEGAARGLQTDGVGGVGGGGTGARCRMRALRVQLSGGAGMGAGICGLA